VNEKHAQPQAANPPASLGESVKRAIGNPAFLAVFAVLFVAALSLNAATQYMKLYFKKEPVPLARALETIPRDLGPWVQVSEDEALNPEMLDVLGTRQYVFREYVDSRVAGEKFMAELKGKTTDEKSALLAQLVQDHPGSLVRAAVTYYTGMVDTVAHIPDRCYVADGFVPSDYTTPSWDVRDKDGKPNTIEVRYINFEDTTPGRSSIPRNVAYFFHCNGDYVSDPLAVRVHLQSLFERYGYYAKVELMTTMSDHDASARVMTDFLCNALPEIEKCLPDWKALKQGAKPQLDAGTAGAAGAAH
jgi:hypothetical protein